MTLCPWCHQFLSTPSARRATARPPQSWGYVRISIHALREEGDRLVFVELGSVFPFLSTPSARRATRAPVIVHVCNSISIHALREEGDETGLQQGDRQEDFYPRPPRGGRLNPFGPNCAKKLFLSTPSARRATGGNFTAFHALGKFLSTPSARRATWLSSLSARRWRISIHALREEGDRRCNGTPLKCLIFLSTPSARRATFGSTAAIIEYNKFLSTPSARRATCPHNPSSKPHWYFYPRPPRGGRP